MNINYYKGTQKQGLRQERRSRGVSTLLGALILMALVVVGAVLVFQIFLKDASAQTSDGEVSVESVSLLMATPGASGAALFSMTIENTGNKPVTAVSLVVGNVTQSGTDCPPPSPPAAPDSPTFCFMSAPITSSNSLAPNQAASATGTPTEAKGKGLMVFHANSAYPYSVLVTFTDGSSFAIGGSVVASES